MFQLTAANARAISSLRAAGRLPVGPVAEPELGRAADQAIAALRAERQTAGLRARLDAWVHTDEPEQFDDETLPAAERDRLDASLDGHNRLVGAYWHFVAVLAPYVEAARAEGRTVRCLELASGSGRLALALAEHARRRGLPIDITGSDLSPTAVTAANRRAEGTPGVSFRVLDATTMAGVEPGQFDILFFVQSAHHFSPGLLARITASGARVAGRVFVGIDGFRAPWMPLIVGATSVVYPQLAHDALISTRKFYSAAELRVIGELAVGADRLVVSRRWPGWSVWTAVPEGRPASA